MCTFYLTILLTIISVFISCRKQDKEILLEKDSTVFVRGIAIMFVIFVHTMQHTNADDSMLNHLNQIGNLVVGTFFLLSGYGNTLSYKKNKKHLEKWTLKRILRIYITFWVVWLIDLVAVMLINNDTYNITTLIKQAVTLTLPYWVNWYLKVQVISYVLFYIAYKLFKKNNDIVLLILTIICTAVLCILKLDVHWWNTVICFGMGSILAERKDLILNKLKNKNKYILLVVSLIISVILFLLGTRYKNITIISSVAFCVFITIMLLVFKFRSTIVCTIGNISLEIYLWHLVLLKVLFRNYRNIINLNANILLLFVLSIALSYITNKLIRKII